MRIRRQALVTGTVKLIAVDKQNQVRTIPPEVQKLLAAGQLAVSWLALAIANFYIDTMRAFGLY